MTEMISWKTEGPFNLDHLMQVVKRLRDPEVGCPWDIQQSFKSILSSTLEECYELIDAIQKEDFSHVEEELGDVLFQVVFYAQMGSEESYFDFASVVDGLVKKLIRRHPHVFGSSEENLNCDAKRDDSHMSVSEVKDTWEKIKVQERRAKDHRSALADVPLALPSLSRAQKIQKRASQVGFDWKDVDGPLEKIEEELLELRDSLSTGDRDQIKSELGDLLFSCVNLSRHLNLDAEESLRCATAKFEKRFVTMENEVGRSGRLVKDLSMADYNTLWEKAKKLSL